MKKLFEALFFLLPVFLVAGLVYVWLHGVTPQPKGLTVSPTQKPKEGARLDFETNYYGFEVNNLSQLKLIVNSSKLEAKKLISKNNCKLAINGGFYGQDQKPLGLIVADKQVLSEQVDSLLLNGYLWISDLGGFGITETLPDTELSMAIQSGPLLFVNGEKRILTINNDKQARRSVVATLANNNLWFLIIFDKTSVFLGPKLATLPSIIEKIAKAENKVIIEALNLDGGTASMFRNQEVFLNEFKSIGSLFCVTSE